MSRTVALASAVLLAAATAEAGAQTSLTIYADGRVLARQVIPIRVPAGLSQHRLALGSLDPGSVFSLDSTLVITGAQFDGAVDDQNTMRRAVGRRITFRVPAPRDTVSAMVLGTDPERFQMADGTVSFGRPGQPMYPAELVLLEPTLTIGLRARTARPSLGLGWFTSGASWQANYQVMLRGDRARIAGHAAIQSGARSVDSAEVQLLAGNVGNAERPSFRDLAGRAGEMVAMARAPMEMASSEQVGEAYLYTIPGRLTLRPGVVTTAGLFEPAETGVERIFTVGSNLPYRGPIGQTGDEGEVPVAVTYVLRRAARTTFGDLPIPGGVVRLYQADAAGRPKLVGEAMVGHTAAGQDLRVDAGSAFDLTARRVQTSYVTRRDSSRTIATAGYRVTIANAKDSVVTVDVLEDRWGEWRVIQSSVPADRPSATRARFRVRVPAKGEVVLTYTLQVTW